MKTIGIIGGLSPESTVSYYKGLNEGAQKVLGEMHNAKILMSSVDFGVFCALKEQGDWETQGQLLAAEAQSLERGGADFIILATNTMHKMAAEIEAAINIPFLHIGDATAAKIKAQGLDVIGLLGTRYTMEMDFYKGRLEAQDLKALVPDEAGRESIHSIIYDELCRGVVKDESRAVYQQVIEALIDEGAQGIVFGCTEIELLLEQNNVSVPVFNTARIHIEAALDKAFV